MNTKLRNYIPNEYKESIDKVDFLSLYNQGYKLVLIDIDNTLVSYDTNLPTKANMELIENIRNIGFEVVLISNNYYKRVSRFAAPFGDIPFVHFAKKPWKRGYKRALKKTQKEYQNSEVVSIGDQLLTDVKGSNKMGFYSILVEPIAKKSDVLTTKINRYFAKKKIQKIKRKYPNIYEEVLKEYEKL